MTKKKPAKPQSHLEFRSAIDGTFKSDAQAARMNPDNVVRQHVPKPGKGTAGRRKSR